MGHIRGESRGQVSLFPPTLDEVVPAEHVCRVIDAFVDGLDLLRLGFDRAAAADTGRPPYDPADLLKLYVYGYLHQVRSSRRLEAECRRNVEVMWLLGRLTPDHKTIAEFRRTEGEGLKSVCAGFVSFLRAAGLVRGEWVAIDGSKFQAVASSKSVPSIEALQRQVAQYLQSLEQADASDVDAEVVPPATIQAALSKLQAARTAGANRPLSEPEARLMRGQAGPCYNVQTAVDSECGVIVTHEVTDEATDNRSLQPMAEAAQKALAAASLNVVADAGYSNGEQVQALEEQGIVTYVPVNRAINNQGDGTLFDRSAFEYQKASDSYRCPAGQRLTRKQTHTPDKATIYAAQSSVCANCALKPRCTTSTRRFLRRHWYEEALTRLFERTTSRHMRLRRRTVERPFAEIKWRIFEKPRFLLRGQRGAGTEMAIAVLVYNLKQALRVLGNGNLIARLSSA